MPTVIDKAKEADDNALRELAGAELDLAVAHIRFFSRTTSLDLQKVDEVVVDSLTEAFAATLLDARIDLDSAIEALRDAYKELAEQLGEEDTDPPPPAIALAPAPAGASAGAVTKA